MASIDVVREGDGAASVPKQGPLIFIANHPFGVVDGLVLCDLAAQTRGRFKILIHAALCQDVDLAPYFLPVDFEETKAAIRTNIGSKRVALETLAADGTRVIFPSGGVSTAFSKFGFGPVAEWPWTTFTAKLVHQSRASVVPVFFYGTNSAGFTSHQAWRKCFVHRCC